MEATRSRKIYSMAVSAKEELAELEELEEALEEELEG